MPLRISVAYQQQANGTGRVSRGTEVKQWGIGESGFRGGGGG